MQSEAILAGFANLVLFGWGVSSRSNELRLFILDVLHERVCLIPKQKWQMLFVGDMLVDSNYLN